MARESFPTSSLPLANRKLFHGHVESVVVGIWLASERKLKTYPFKLKFTDIYPLPCPHEHREVGHPRQSRMPFSKFLLNRDKSSRRDPKLLRVRPSGVASSASSSRHTKALSSLFGPRFFRVGRRRCLLMAAVAVVFVDVELP